MLSEQKKRRLHADAQMQAEAKHKELEAALQTETESASRLAEALLNYKGHDRLVQEKILGFREETVENLTNLVQTPYFTTCNALLEGKEGEQTFFFAKHSHSPSSIYSWITPASTMRFEDIGPCAYKLPDGTIQKLVLLRKDQFMIVKDHVIYMTTEDEENERTLVYQEYFSSKKQQFALTDIVAQMEKAQDDVIRADPRGSLLITGPAGSGKTTLALHRLAYLAQSPDTMELFPSNRMIIFVHDPSTQAYFSNLLPELGIHNVTITTFEDWAADQLNIKHNKLGRAITDDLDGYEEYQFQKNAALEAVSKVSKFEDPYRILEKIYKPFLNKKTRALFEMQVHEKSLDRFDLTVLLSNQRQLRGSIGRMRSLTAPNKEGRYITKTRYVPLNYSCMVLDEIQNYLPEQIRLLRSCIDAETNAMLYVGDLAQQTRLCTLKDWKHVNEEFTDGRHVNLTKAYRNTKQILDYIRSQGFTTNIQSLRDGEPVKVSNLVYFNDRLAKLDKILESHRGRLTGVLFKDLATLEKYSEKLQHKYPETHFMTASEAQGVEFSTVCLVEMTHSPDRRLSTDEIQKAEQTKVQEDQLYVSLTRAIDELYIINS